MDSTAAISRNRRLLAFTLPMGIFLLFLALKSALATFGRSFWLASSEYWIYPTQTIVCGILLISFRRHYDLGPLRRVFFTAGVALVVFLLWISPQAFFGFTPRTVGFNPDIFAGNSAAYWTTIVLRFLRLVVVVPLVEEIFWRGFLLRYFIAEKFWAVPFGAFSWLSFVVVIAGFGFAHSSADRIAAFVTGALYNCVAYRTKSLSSCVLAHALTNFLLGLWIMRTRQWGFW